MPYDTITSPLRSFDLEGLRFTVPEREFVAVNPKFETVTRRMLFERLGPGSVFVDVGAHVGTIGLPAARVVGPTGHVHAVEASPPTVELLEANAARNGISNITIHRCAAGAFQGRADYNLMLYSYVNGFAQRPGAEKVDTVQVDVRPLDDLVQGRVDVVKIDVEGGELEVLQGMSRILEENPEVLLCVELNPLALKTAGHNPL